MRFKNLDKINDSRNKIIQIILKFALIFIEELKTAFLKAIFSYVSLNAIDLSLCTNLLKTNWHFFPQNPSFYSLYNVLRLFFLNNTFVIILSNLADIEICAVPFINFKFLISCFCITVHIQHLQKFLADVISIFLGFCVKFRSHFFSFSVHSSRCGSTYYKNFASDIFTFCS